MRRLHFHGSVNDGETVEVRGRWQPGELLVVKRIQNISAGSPVVGEGRPHPLLKILVTVLVLAVFVTAMALLIISVFNKGPTLSGGAGVPSPPGVSGTRGLMTVAAGAPGPRGVSVS